MRGFTSLFFHALIHLDLIYLDLIHLDLIHLDLIQPEVGAKYSPPRLRGLGKNLQMLAHHNTYEEFA